MVYNIRVSTIIALRNEIQQQYQYERSIRVGAAGGISTPESALAAFMMGASYISFVSDLLKSLRK